mmetsp:Transcript_40813/g.115758  ORF Transcript_40813/g.115758 Transcript_40813/m.115758 type:complete len:244 (+) Transcript_40813:664-1395(+)
MANPLPYHVCDGVVLNLNGARVPEGHPRSLGVVPKRPEAVPLRDERSALLGREDVVQIESIATLDFVPRDSSDSSSSRLGAGQLGAGQLEALPRHFRLVDDVGDGLLLRPGRRRAGHGRRACIRVHVLLALVGRQRPLGQPPLEAPRPLLLRRNGGGVGGGGSARENGSLVGLTVGLRVAGEQAPHRVQLGVACGHGSNSSFAIRTPLVGNIAGQQAPDRVEVRVARGHGKNGSITILSSARV